MSQPQKKDIPDEESANSAMEHPALSLEEALLACMPTAKVASLHDQANASRLGDDDANQASSGNRTGGLEDEDVVVPPPALFSSPPLEEAVLACMPGAFQIPGPSDPTITTTAADYIDPLHVIVQEEEDELRSLSSATTVDIEREEQQQPTQTNIVSAYRVAEQEPAIIATPLKDNRVRILGYGFLVTAAVALIVGLSVGLTVETIEEPPSIPVDRLVSSVNMTGVEDGSFVKANRYIRTEDGKESVFTTGNAALNRCEVLPCNEGGCDLLSFGKVYKPGCCRGDDCDRRNKCGYMCPERTNLCHPAYVGCTDASCFECERGPSGEELYRRRSDSLNIKCLRTGVAIGFNDKDDNVERIYKWAIVCGYIVHGGMEWLNIAPGEYVCIAVRAGNGITKSLSIPLPCQLIQLGECGCAPDDVNTFGLFPPPDKPCKTKQDCPFLCGDAGEEKAKTLCEAFPGIEWWEGENPLYQSSFYEPGEALWGNTTVQIDISISMENRFV